MPKTQTTLTVALEPTTQAFIDALAAKGDPPIYTLAVEDARKVLEGAQANPAFLPAADIEELSLPSGVNISIIRPPGPYLTEKMPGVVYFHGGGWILGSAKTHDRLMRSLAVSARAAVVYVDFSRSPEARFPVAIEEAYAAFQHLAENGGKYLLDGAKLAVAGDSAGGNMATVITLLAIQRGGVLPRCQALFYPVTSADLSTESYAEFAGGPWLTKKAMEWFWNAYAPSASSRRSAEVSPILASRELLAQMPDTLVITGEADVLRDEGEEYARCLTAAGVKTTAIRYLGTTHDFMMLNALAETPAARHATQVASDFLSVCLHK